MHLIPNWFRSSCCQIGVFENFAKFMGKHLCWSHFLTTLQISMPETSLKNNSGTGIFQWIFRSFSKNLIYKTSLDDYSCWFLRENQSFIHWSHCLFFSSLFSFIIVNCNYESLLRKCLKIKTFNFTIVYSKNSINVVKTISPQQ